MKKLVGLGVMVLFGLTFLAPAYAADRAPWSLQRSSKIIGSDVENAQGEDLGDIEDIVIDPNNGQIAYAVISFGGFLGLGEKWFAVPMSALQRSPKEADTFVLNMDKERLRNAPGFDRNNWPRLDDRQWVSNVYTFYNQPPYWAEASAAITATVAETKGNTVKLKTADGRTTELAVPAAVLQGLQAGDRVEVTIREK